MYHMRDHIPPTPVHVCLVSVVGVVHSHTLSVGVFHCMCTGFFSGRPRRSCCSKTSYQLGCESFGGCIANCCKLKIVQHIRVMSEGIARVLK